jgi:hypothetical protein
MRHPALCFSFGTAVGFAMTNESGEVTRPRAHVNWEIGSVRMATRASQREIWWALGSEGLAELQHNMGEANGTTHYGYRLATLIRDFTILFQPRVVVLAGGIIDRHRDVLMPVLHAELSRNLPEEVEKPHIVPSPFGANSGLVGAAIAGS